MKILNPCSVNAFAAILSRKDPDEINAAAAELLENGRRDELKRLSAAAAAEREILEKALKDTSEDPDRSARLARAVVVAAGEQDLSDIAAASISRIRKPSRDSLILSGCVMARCGELSSGAVLVFMNSKREEIEHGPVIKLRKDGDIASVIEPSILKRLIGALGDNESAFLAVRIDERIVATTPRPVRIAPGLLIQVNLMF
jgi:hypothetical protein